jgi:hypothetical protein
MAVEGIEAGIAALAVEEEENPQVRRMSKQSLREIPSKKGIPFEAFDYGPPVRNNEFFKRRCARS